MNTIHYWLREIMHKFIKAKWPLKLQKLTFLAMTDALTFDRTLLMELATCTPGEGATRGPSRTNAVIAAFILPLGTGYPRSQVYTFPNFKGRLSLVPSPLRTNCKEKGYGDGHETRVGF